MNAAMRVLLMVLATGTLAGCYVDDGPAYRRGPAYSRNGPYVEGHFGPNGFWIPGHYR